MSALDGVFYISLSTLICGGIGLAIKACYKVKCSEVNCCCGLVSFRRDIDEEVCVDLETREVNTPKSKRSSLSLGFNKI
jgi:hypothetical protein